MTLALAISSVAFAQESFDPRGFPQPPSRRAPTIGVESDLARAYADEDVHLSASYEGSYGDRWYGSLQTLSAGKRFGDHTIFVRYRPGAAQRFGFGSLVEVPSEDRTASLTTSIDYREPFAFGYTFSPFKGLRVGMTWRYYAEDVAVEEIAATVDTATFDVEIVEETQTFAPNVWRADVGVSYQAREDLRASLGYANLVVAAEGDAGVDPAHLLRFEPTGIFGVDYDPLPRLRLGGRVETTGSFYLGVATSFSLLGGELSLGAAAARDWRMTPFIAAAQPSIRFAGDVFAISVVGAYYFSDRTAFRSLSNFLDRGVY
ncbi:MAG: hypothetical protein GF419_13360, partial [Ignavibacteriales bacterium]|nr:hypothetical protein [Ignavibacteriales bacterium]